MISCKLQGGLGNQMFQIAATYSLAIDNKDVYGFDFESCYTPLQGNPATKYRDSIFAELPDMGIEKARVIYNEQGFAYQDLPYAPDLQLVGFFQSEKYFKQQYGIKRLFKLNDKLFVNNWLVANGCNMNMINPKPTVGVHVRRGDYLNNSDYHCICPLEYYKAAMEYFPDSVFIFVSDDMDWVRDNFKGPNILYSKFNDEVLDMTILTLCDNVIIANSSFSWWGAYLNYDIGKKIIAPKQWFGPLGPKDTQDLIPESWITI